MLIQFLEGHKLSVTLVVIFETGSMRYFGLAVPGILVWGSAPEIQKSHVHVGLHFSAFFAKLP